MQGNQSYTTNLLCTQKGGMETLGGNEVNPGYWSKKFSAKVFQGQSRQQNQNKKPKLCKIKKNQRM